jgi:putative endonuclease
MEKQFSVYVIENEIGDIYIGQTDDFEKRLERHNGILKSKAGSFTNINRKGLWKLIYSEIYRTRKEALSREKQLKSYRGREFIKSQVTKNLGR